jgi:hypothetical protein
MRIWKSLKLMSLKCIINTVNSAKRQENQAIIFVNYKKGCTHLAAASDKAYQLLIKTHPTLHVVWLNHFSQKKFCTVDMIQQTILPMQSESAKYGMNSLNNFSFMRSVQSISISFLVVIAFQRFFRICRPFNTGIPKNTKCVYGKA